MNLQHSASPTERARRRAEVLARLGKAVRARREAAKLTRRELAERCGVSERFLAQLEAGDGNISIARLHDVADALATSAHALMSESESAARPHAVALIGLRGAGKSTVGRIVAAQLGVPFHELDEHVAREAGMDLGTLFEIHGEAYFRRLELEALRALLAKKEPCVIATGGSIVSSREAFELLLKETTVVWLKARPQEHWDRVVAQGDVRPMKNRANAMGELKSLLRARKPEYARAHWAIETSGVAPARVVDGVVRAAYAGPKKD